MQLELPTLFRASLTQYGIPFKDYGYRDGDEEIVLNVRTLPDDKLAALEEELAKFPEGRSARVHLSAWRKAKADPKTAKIATFKALHAALTDYFVDGAIRGWAFNVSSTYIYPALIRSITYYPSEKDNPAHIVISFGLQNEARQAPYTVQSVSITADDAKGRSLLDILQSIGWQKETPELLAEYDKIFENYKEYMGMFGKQFVLKKSMTRSRRRTWYERRKDDVDLSLLGGGKMVMNQQRKSVEEGRFRRTEYGGQSDLELAIEKKHGKDAVPFSKAPYDMDITMFHLAAHEDVNVRPEQVEVYQYKKEIKKKLVLPETTMELLDTLTEELDLVQEDVVMGKSGGNVVLLAGSPGTGKTLTAEIYAEYREAPLYKVHSGQLGTDAKEIEKSLEMVYKRASSWGNTIVLLDEFDVFGRARADNLEQNAVVAVFLRTLEYQGNTIFLTTNRADTMDDAILSRCSAIINYNVPDGYNAQCNMWKVLSDQFLPDTMSTEEIAKLVTYFYKAQKTLSGRDIKDILKLAYRYKRTGKKVDKDLMIKCAGFRGIQSGA